MSDVLNIFLIGLTSLILLFLLAQCLKRVYRELDDFKSIVLVILSITSIYAGIKSELHSYLIAVFLLFTYILIKKAIRKPVNLPKAVFSQSAWTESLVLFVFYYCFSFFVFNIRVFFESSSYSNLHPDFSFYAGVSELLSTRGTESILIDAVIDGQKSFVFYHYFELWFNGMISSFSGVTHLNSLMFITLPLFSSVMLKGVNQLLKDSSIVSSSRKITYYFIPVTILFLFPYTSTFRWVMSLGSKFEPWNNTMLSLNPIKYIIVVSGLIYLFLDYKANKLKNTVIILMFLTLAYPTTLFAVLPSVFLWLLLYGRQFKRETVFDYLISLLIIFVVFLRVSDNIPSKQINSTSTLTLIKQFYFLNPKRFLLFITEPVLRTIYITIAFLPLIMLLWFERSRLKNLFANNKVIISFFGIAYAVSAIGIVFLDFSFDGDQLHTNLFYPLYILLFFFGLAFLLYSRIRKLGLAALVLLCFTVLLNATGVFYKEKNNESLACENLSSIISTLSTSGGGQVFLADTNYFKKQRHKNIYLGIPAANLRKIVSNYYPQCLSLDRIKLSNLSDTFNFEKTIKSAHFYEDIVSKRLTYKEVFSQSRDLNVLIIQKTAPEFNDAETVFEVTKLGEIGQFAFYRRK